MNPRDTSATAREAAGNAAFSFCLSSLAAFSPTLWATLMIVLVVSIQPAAGTQYGATPPLAVSGSSPFADCTADELVDNPIVLEQESEPHVVVDPRDPDHVVGTWIQDQRVNAGNGRGFGVAASFDGGQSWETTYIEGMGVCTGGTFYYHSDPWLAFGPDGSLFQIGLPWWPGPAGPVPEGFSDVIAVTSSADGGLTWSSPLALDASAYPNYGDDKPSITVDRLDPRYVYASWTYYPGEAEEGNVTRFSRSTDGGITWEAPRTVFEPGLGFGTWNQQIHVLPDGTLVSISEQFNLPRRLLVVQRSADYGATWEPTDSEAFVLEIARVRARAPDDSFLLSKGQVLSAMDPETGALYAVWQGLQGGVAQATLSLSTDAGATWSTPIVVAQTPQGKALRSQSFLPMVAVAGDGTVGVLYYDFRYDDAESDTRTDVWLIHCHARTANCADPASWHGEARVTERSFDLKQSAPLYGGERCPATSSETMSG
jgi:hypothetical protein